MKTKHLFGLVAAVAVTGFAASARAGWSVDISFGLPVPVYCPPRVVVAPPCPPPVFCPPVVCRPAPVYVCPLAPPCRPVVYAAPRHGYQGYRGYGHDRDQRGWSHEERGYYRGGYR
jgi:hypothetical protein